MTPRRTPNVYRRRVGWTSIVPVSNRSGLWLQVRWLWWTWDHFPSPVAASFGRVVDNGREGAADVVVTRKNRRARRFVA